MVLVGGSSLTSEGPSKFSSAATTGGGFEIYLPEPGVVETRS